MNINLISPYIRTAMRSLLPAEFKIRRRILLDYEIIYLESGEWRLWYDGVEYICRAGDFVFLRPGVPHSIEVLSKPVSQPHIHFDMCYSSAQSEKRFVCFRDLPDLSAEERQLIHKDIIKGPHPPVISAVGKATADRLYRIIGLYKKHDILSQLEIKAELMSIIGELLSSFGESATVRKAEPLSQMVKEFIENNLSERITLELLSMHFHYNKFYIEKRFREDVGVSVSRYYNSLRVEAIKDFLLSGNSVTETASAFSFDSIYSFSRYFKNATGLSPTKFVKEKRPQE
ncbi:MAG: helix-turn-helix transcriptional regulator [Clostridia bacterium]|nr:helix-turn-helix transcriptional regulator [Clostridia bacterium]